MRASPASQPPTRLLEARCLNRGLNRGPAPSPVRQRQRPGLVTLFPSGVPGEGVGLRDLAGLLWPGRLTVGVTWGPGDPGLG